MSAIATTLIHHREKDTSSGVPKTIHMDLYEYREVLAILRRYHQKKEKTKIRLVSHFFDQINLGKPTKEKGMRALNLTLGGTKNQMNEKLIRTIDFVFSGLVLLFWSPFHLILSIIIAHSSKGGAIYTQERIGQGTLPFKIFKYRSMKADCNDAIHREYLEQLHKNPTRSSLQGDKTPLKLLKDPRITPIGHFIRKFSLDEIPQFYNVFKGEMSLIGPRPCLDYELKQMLGWHMIRFDCPQGMSGLWQVYGRSRCSIEQSQFLDGLSALYRSPLIHLKLIFMTPVVMLTQKGAF